MRKAKLKDLVGLCDQELQIAGFPDYKGAANGLQVENQGSVVKIAACVDASLSTARKAVEAGANLMLVHHGLFWGPSHPWTGKRYQLIRFLIENDLAVYSAHLPLDAHPTLGNNAILARKLGFKRLKPFYAYEGRQIGVRAKTVVSRAELQHRLATLFGADPVVVPGGADHCHEVGIITGGAGGEIARIAAEGVDTLITGEGPHWTYALAEDLGVNVFYAGHYATETFGVQALASFVADRFRIPWQFVDHPTGL